jgi:2-C-methyl-D-erythritol 4-phosphate cytidylyltransferase / 2-C-methyl-D-erythritol 2,4-cyclodiphosphate synthase
VYSAAVIIPAAGTGSRMKSRLPKPFILIGGKPVLWHTLSLFIKIPGVNHIIIAAAGEYTNQAKEIADSIETDVLIEIVAGGKERINSVYLCAQKAIDADLIAVHDAVRPFAQVREIIACFDRAYQDGAAILAVQARDTIKTVDEGRVTGTADRSQLWLAQTPQVFRREIFMEACDKAIRSGLHFTDDAAMVEHIGGNVFVVPGSSQNMKITYPADLITAESMLDKTEINEFRTGIGFDVHQLATDRKLILGGVEIPHSKGLLGHSDADVLLHAIIDAMLGAAALGDLGHFYPDTDMKYRNIDSRILLRDAAELVHSKGYMVVNIDATIVAEKPRIAPHIPEMKSYIASDLATDIDRISIKATTSEKIGFAGREEGISATAVITLRR